MRNSKTLALVTVLAALAAACGGIGPDHPTIGSPDPLPPTTVDPLAGDVTIVAASSLTEAFTALADEFERDHPAVDVLPSFAASSQIAAQLDAGVGADVVATADERTMADIVGRGRASGLELFASNRIEIAVERGNPRGITTVVDLARDDLLVVACIPEAPCGALADLVLAEAGLRIDLVSREPNVKAAVAKVELGEVDAALVYATDVVAGDVDGVPIETTLRNRYPIALTTDSSNPEAARAFIDFVLGERGQQVLRDFAFGEA